MRINCLTTFLDGTDRFEKGDTRTVDDERGARFISSGWARDIAVPIRAEPEAAIGATDLDIHNSTLGTGDSNG